jgi:hydrogenase maturation protein HypF
MKQSLKIKITGQVQGVGFRPFIYRLAHKHHLTGWVQNCSGEVMVLVQGHNNALEQFQADILAHHPPLAIPVLDSVEAVQEQPVKKFYIAASAESQKAERHIPPDYFTCPDCLKELTSPEERRYRYPFINCTQCGPRYTIIEDLPYDRPFTSMKEFPLCPDCLHEYQDTLDRRFHAQPLACAKCGPHLEFLTDSTHIQDNEAALAAVKISLQQGKILAIKGIGGYHLICDAQNDQAVNNLRSRKHRPHKPLAVMFANAEQLLQFCRPTSLELDTLTSPQRPIVLIKTLAAHTLAPGLNPGLNEIGAMLAYSPLHYLILDDFGSPIVATSGNISGEPVITDNLEAQQRLQNIADAFLQHNRPIVRPADDSVLRVIGQQPRWFRIGRGKAPLELNLPFTLKKPVLATGGQMKNTIALAWDDRIVISPHIGELETRRSIAVYHQVIEDLCHLYRIKPEQIICDAHPDYYSSRFARQYAQQQQIPVTVIQHHRAHAGIVYGEYYQHIQSQPCLMFSWDGTGLGNDNSIWGGETFYGRPGSWLRVVTLTAFQLQGGDKAAREPWRSAAALMWSHELNYQPTAIDSELTEMVHQAWQQSINTSQCSSMGRLFDAASALLGLGETSSFEGQGPMKLEALLKTPIKATGQKPLPYSRQKDIDCIDWYPLLNLLADQQLTIEQRASQFHEIIAETLIDTARRYRNKRSVTHVGLSGGVFQNRALTNYVLERLEQEQFIALLPAQIPYNDAGLAFGQIIEGADYDSK